MIIASTSIIFKKIKKPININEVDSNKIFFHLIKDHMENKDLIKCYIEYLGGTGFRPFHIIIKNIKL